MHPELCDFANAKLAGLKIHMNGLGYPWADWSGKEASPTVLPPLPEISTNTPTGSSPLYQHTLVHARNLGTLTLKVAHPRRNRVSIILTLRPVGVGSETWIQVEKHLNQDPFKGVYSSYFCRHKGYGGHNGAVVFSCARNDPRFRDRDAWRALMDVFQSRRLDMNEVLDGYEASQVLMSPRHP